MINKFLQHVFLIAAFSILIVGKSYGEDDIFSNNAAALKNYHYQIADVLTQAHNQVHFYKNGDVADAFCPSVTDSQLYTKDNSVSTKGCPALTTQCQLKPYLVNGNHVLIVKQNKDMSCVWFPNKQGFAEGWVPTKFLHASQLNAAVHDDWLGKWYMPNTEISFSKGNSTSQLILNGNSQWVGQGEGNVNVGELKNEKINVTDSDATLKTDTCQISFKLINHDHLLAVDNGSCGGLNVSFGGIYTRVKR